MNCPNCGNMMTYGAPHCETIKTQLECHVCGHYENDYYTQDEMTTNQLAAEGWNYPDAVKAVDLGTGQYKLAKELLIKWRDRELVQDNKAQSGELIMQSESLNLRRVYWTKYHVTTYHDHAPTLQHLTADAGLRGKTLCGRKFPADKGQAQGWKFCKRCVQKAYALGFVKGFTKELDFVPSEED